MICRGVAQEISSTGCLFVNNIYSLCKPMRDVIDACLSILMFVRIRKYLPVNLLTSNKQFIHDPHLLQAKFYGQI